MKIAIFSPPLISLPPVGYGGIENVVYNLTEELHNRKHEVYTYATGNSHISANLKYFYNKSLGVDLLLEKSYIFYFLNHVYFALKNLPSDIEIIHNHCEMAAMHLLDQIDIPFVHTLHGPLPSRSDFLDSSGNMIPTKYMTRANYETLNLFKHHHFVSVSNSQRKAMPDLNYRGTVYNSVDIHQLKFYETNNEDYFFWLGRYSPQKGIEKAIETAKLTSRKLIIAAKVHEKRFAQFDSEILSKIDGEKIKFIGEVNSTENKCQLMGKSKLFIFPIQWEEPFGIVMIEAMACGTPVVAFARGSVPEVMKDGETGFIVNSSDNDIRGNWIIKKTGIEGLCEAVERIYAMPEEEYRQMRKNCRAHVEQNFSVERMVDAYEKVYEEILVNR